jgi:sulfatase maturation enzyme AslB (radical SAM superfamily)
MGQACLTSHGGGYLGVIWKTVSEACNLACDYCNYSSCGGQPGKIEKIDPNILDKFIKKYMALSNGVSSFAWQGGEPLLAGLDFQKVVFLQGKYAPKNTIISNAVQINATLITDEWARSFKHYHCLIGVSLDGPKEINDVRRVSGNGTGSYDRILEAFSIYGKTMLNLIFFLLNKKTLMLNRNIKAFLDYSSIAVKNCGKYSLCASSISSKICFAILSDGTSGLIVIARRAVL